MSPALPIPARPTLRAQRDGPWGGFITGLAENIEYNPDACGHRVLHRAYLGSIFGTPAAFQPVWWIAMYVVFVGLNVLAFELSFRVSVLVTLLALAVLAIFWPAPSSPDSWTSRAGRSTSG